MLKPEAKTCPICHIKYIFHFGKPSYRYEMVFTLLNWLIL